jgi:serine/threonine protein kinase
MHILQIIHKDIKPPNILYSYEHKKAVFCDFGISHTVQ